jgi:hypothetical protein
MILWEIEPLKGYLRFLLNTSFKGQKKHQDFLYILSKKKKKRDKILILVGKGSSFRTTRNSDAYYSRLHTAAISTQEQVGKQ